MDEVFCYAGDLLGYKNILLSLPPREQMARISEFMELTHDAANRYGFQDSYITASDTVFLIAENSKDSLKRLLEFSRYMLENGLKKALPIRAAIDFGPAEIDKKSKLVYGKAAAQAYELAEKQDWIGTCCAENSIDEDEKERPPKLPYLNELWDFDLVFCYPVPMKDGQVLFRPVVSWEVPSYRDIRTWTVERGLVSEGNMDWKYVYRIQNTIIFSQYLSAVKFGPVDAKPESFKVDLPIQYLDNMIQDHIHETHLIRRGHATIIKMHGRDTKIILTDDIDQIIEELTRIRDSESPVNQMTSNSNTIA